MFYAANLSQVVLKCFAYRAMAFRRSKRWVPSDSVVPAPARPRVCDPSTASDCMCVLAVRVKGKTLFFDDVLISEAVDVVKAKIKARTDIPQDKLRLFRRGKQLMNGHKLSDYMQATVPVLDEATVPVLEVVLVHVW